MLFIQILPKGEGVFSPVMYTRSFQAEIFYPFSQGDPVDPQ